MLQHHEHLPARNTDPQTSHEAAAAIVRTGDRAHMQHLAYAAVRAYPGLTSLELATASGLCRFMLARRLPEIEEAGLVKRGDKRRCAASTRGFTAVTWWPEPVQLDMVAGA